ncbi:hypothetical protein PIB30_028124 [Stylosanthes scabra]|uniref:rRNA N-glycosidase n=1 Tax=Stylosanthes scabra TaxID=79078 RepID=A0ABU6UAB8_9FABA|nr:hypothetical protein [Stylosanthes scabra]
MTVDPVDVVHPHEHTGETDFDGEDPSDYDGGNSGSGDDKFVGTTPVGTLVLLPAPLPIPDLSTVESHFHMLDLDAMEKDPITDIGGGSDDYNLDGVQLQVGHRFYAEVSTISREDIYVSVWGNNCFFLINKDGPWCRSNNVRPWVSKSSSWARPFEGHSPASERRGVHGYILNGVVGKDLRLIQEYSEMLSHVAIASKYLMTRKSKKSLDDFASIGNDAPKDRIEVVESTAKWTQMRENIAIGMYDKWRASCGE